MKKIQCAHFTFNGKKTIPWEQFTVHIIHWIDVTNQKFVQQTSVDLNRDFANQLHRHTQTYKDSYNTRIIWGKI